MKELYLFFHADKPEPEEDDWHVRYYRHDQELHLTLPIDALMLLRNGGAASFQLMKDSLQELIPLIEEEEIADFDVAGFEKAVKDLR